jgi:hypothetical protein
MTDRNFSADISTDSVSPKLVPDAMIAVRCPYCGREHTWEPRKSPSAENIPLNA